MKLFDRLYHAFIGFIFGAFLGVVCWFLYGLAFSIRYDGPGIDPMLRHWIGWTGGGFALLGFIFREQVAIMASDTLVAILFLETDSHSRRNDISWVAGVFVLIICFLIWRTIR